MNPQFLALLKAVVVGPLLLATSQQSGQMTEDERDLLAFVGLGMTAFGIVDYFRTYGTLPEQQLTAEPGEIIDVEVTEVTPEAEPAPQWPEWITPGYWWQ